MRSRLDDLAAHFELKTCRSVVEFGCGTGRFAEELFETYLSQQAIYVGRDISNEMVRLATERLTRYQPRATVEKSDGAAQVDSPNGAFDKFISTFVLDLLPDAEAQAVVREARRLLASDGLAGLVSLTNGKTRVAWAITTTWNGLRAVSPRLVGGAARSKSLLWSRPRTGRSSTKTSLRPSASLRDRRRKGRRRVITARAPGPPKVRSVAERPTEGTADDDPAIRLETAPVAENDALRPPGKDLLVGAVHGALLRPKRQAKVGGQPAPG